MAARLWLLVLGLLSGCSTYVDYGALRPGTFRGSVYVMWVNGGDPGIGDGLFLYVPVPGDELVFTRPDGREIVPGPMYTDGGSIPKPFQAFRGLSPWGYGPAYVIHDWLFVARHCILDDHPTDLMRKLADIDFPASVEIIGEAIKALVADGRVRRSDIVASAVTGAVSSFISEGLWNTHGACDARTAFPPEVVRRIARGLPDSSAARTYAMFGLAPPSGAERRMMAAEPAATIVARLRF